MIDLKSLVGKLNGLSRGALEASLGLAVSNGHYNVEIEHWLIKLSDAADSDFQALIRHYKLDDARLRADLDRVIRGLKTGSSRTPMLAPQVVDLIREAWLVASLEDGAPQIRSGHVLSALLFTESLARVAHAASGQFARIPPDDLRRDRRNITETTAEMLLSTPPGGSSAAAAATPGGERALDKFTIDLTARARAGKIDPVLGRDAEIRQVIDILTRRRQNNPILTGEAGVGKTAVVEGFALRIAAGDVPAALKPVSVRTLDLGLLQAGAGMRGEFENRLKNVIEEVQASTGPIILFIDEAHTLIGAGGQAGQNDAANLLKPALARGDLRTIAATTWAEYKKYFERDAALARRFQVVKVEEPGESAAVAMMRGLVATLERHHNVRILDQAVVEAVRLSNRYVTGRQLPDKAVSLLDTACARVAMSAEAVPAAIEDLRREIEVLTTELGILERESAAGAGDRERFELAGARRIQAAAELRALEARWQQEKIIVDAIRNRREALEAGVGKPDPDGEVTVLRLDLATLTEQLKTLQGESPLIHPCVDGDAVAAVVANWTGIPVGRMMSNEIQAVLDLRRRMGERVVGQPHALNAIAEAIQTSRAKLTDPRKPIGVFLMVGTSGVGKTETALALADLLYGGEQNMTVINMSEFKEEHKVSTLMGSPPGYVGYGEGGVLTEAVRRRPYSVILFDEMEKAHPGVQDVFYQLFDKGMLRDGEGRDIDFKNTLIIMTSNAGTDIIHKLCADPETMPDAEGLAESLRPDLLKVFKPAFLGRVTVVPYFPLADDILRRITALQLGRIRKRIESNYRATFTYAPEVIDSIVSRCKEVQSGARTIDHIQSKSLLPALSEQFLSRLTDDCKISAVEISIGDDGSFVYGIS
ncbi:MAG: type VI secretion system ATPase TssH [Rhodospirillaceae bacterium]